MKTQTVPDVSVVIPAYQEGERIGRTLLEIRDYFQRNGASYEIVVVVDGSPDNTAEVVRNYAEQIGCLRVVEYMPNRGKGYAVRTGLLEARGKYRLFMDADGSTDIAHLEKFLPAAEDGAGVVIGSRDIAGAFIQVHQPKWREAFGDAGNWIIRIVLGLWDYPDTQCGFKLMTAEAAEAVASRMVVDRFGFDFELVVLSEKLGFAVEQMPVRWLDEEGTTVRLFGPNGYVQVMMDLLKTRVRLWSGVYKISQYKKDKKNTKRHDTAKTTTQ